MSVNFNEVCENCPLRTIVDVDRYGLTASMGSDGYSLTLSDGNNRTTICLTEGEVNSSSQLAVSDYATNQQIENCKTPQRGLLRMRCGAGLASAWRWANTQAAYEPNVTTPEEVAAILMPANYLDAMPATTESVLYAGHLRNFSELSCHPQSGYWNCDIKKLGQTVIGSSAKLPRGRAIMLDVATGGITQQKPEDIYRIRVAQAGPSFHFEYQSQPDAIKFDYEAILSTGIFKFLNSTKVDLAHSDKLAVKVVLAQTLRDEEVTDFFDRYLND